MRTRRRRKRHGTGPFTIQCNADLPSVLPLELLSEHLNRVPMCDQQVVPHDPRLAARIADGTLGAIARVARREQARAVPQDARAPRLVKGDPMLAPAAESLEDDTRVVGKVCREFGFVQQSAVPLVQRLRQIPVEERYHWGDARSVQVVDELDVVV